MCISWVSSNGRQSLRYDLQSMSFCVPWSTVSPASVGRVRCVCGRDRLWIQKAATIQNNHYLTDLHIWNLIWISWVSLIGRFILWNSSRWTLRGVRLWLTKSDGLLILYRSANIRGADDKFRWSVKFALILNLLSLCDWDAVFVLRWFICAHSRWFVHHLTVARSFCESSNFACNGCTIATASCFFPFIFFDWKVVFSGTVAHREHWAWSCRTQ